MSLEHSFTLKKNGHTKSEDSVYTSDSEISGDLRTSYTAIRPRYISFPSLNDNARRSPEASHANFSMPRLYEVVKT